MFFIIIINSIIIFSLLSYIDINIFLTTLLSLLPFLMISDSIFVSIPTRITYYYIGLKHKNSIIFHLNNYTNKTLTKLLLSVIFSLRSLEVKDLFTKITLLITIILIDREQNTDSTIIPIYQSIIAAIIFDFIIIKIPQELRRQNAIHVIKNTIYIILNCHIALRNLTIYNTLKNNSIDNTNIKSCLTIIKNTNYNDKAKNTVHVSNSLSYYKETFESKNKNEDILVILKELFSNIDRLMSSSEINEFPELKGFLLKIGNVDYYSEQIKSKAINRGEGDFLGLNLELNLDHNAKAFLDGYLIPLEGICYWYKRKVKRYINDDDRKLIEFSLSSTELFYSYDHDKRYT